MTLLIIPWQLPICRCHPLPKPVQTHSVALLTDKPGLISGGQKYKSELGGYGNVVYNKVTTHSSIDSGVNVVSISAELTVSTAGTTTKEQSIALNIPGDSLSMTGIHHLNQVDGLFTYRDFLKGTVYSSRKRNPFTVNVLKDTIASATGNYPNIIVSGKFDGILYNYYQTDSIRIVGGVFDVKL